MIEIRKIEYGTADLEDAFEVREQVFVVEQNVDHDIEYEFEEESIHFLARVDGKPAGTARWRQTENGIKLERFAILKQYRNKGIASALIQTIFDDLGPKLQTELIYLHAQEAVCELYAKQGFKAVGSRFMEADIPHFKMVLRLT
jgi:predicted GNAT family N-acyltransferase